MFLDLVEDIQIKILNYLTVEEAYPILLTCRSCRDVVLRSNCLWEDWCFQRWPHLSEDAVVLLVKNRKANFYELLRMAAKGQPPVRLLHTDNMMIVNSNEYVVFGPERNGVEYIGRSPVEFSLSLKIPLPRPKQRETIFVSPYRLRNEPKEGVVYLTPRCMSYFEITLHERKRGGNITIDRQVHDDGATNNDHATTSTEPTQRARRSLRDYFAEMEENQRRGATTTKSVVGIGLATKRHCLTHRRFPHGFFPGWNEHSFGYHGDDGKLFHGFGDGTAFEGFPTYGPGDTVGCGVDYRNAAIFFTLNGTFLGHVWKVSTRQDFFPIVGTDAGCPISCNFGQEGFLFDPSTKINDNQWVSCCRSLLKRPKLNLN